MVAHVNQCPMSHLSHLPWYNVIPSHRLHRDACRGQGQGNIRVHTCG